MSKPTIDDVANLAGVSIKTVSRVVNNEPNVRDSTRSQVESAISQLNYRPNISARNLASHRSNLVVLIYDDPSTSTSPNESIAVRLQHGALQACRQANRELLIHPCNYRDKSVRPALRSLIARTRPDGVVIAAPLSNMATITKPFADAGIPFVRLSPGRKSTAEFSVGTNDRAISAEMTRYLASLGHRDIAFVSGNEQERAVANRKIGYQEGLSVCGISYRDSLVISGDSSFESGVAAAERLLARKKPPTAIFAANDCMAAGVMQTAQKKGLRLPSQLSIAGFDDSTLAKYLNPSLTTIQQPLAKMAESAVSALLSNRDEHDRPKGMTVIPSVLVLRESTGPVL
ncbi:MAG: LacI family DNA-binding transcriptional regulator [Pseudomonadota bacterium]